MSNASPKLNCSAAPKTPFALNTTSSPITAGIENLINTGNNSDPVTWHIAFWVLASLAMNSMAQRASQSPNSDFYTRISPLVCLSNTLSQITRILLLSIKARIPLGKAMHLAYRLRMDNLAKQTPGVDFTQTNRHEGMQTWPRWLFFVMGTLPSAVKLCVFEGVLWTKVLGIMFLASFVLDEIITLGPGQRDFMSVSALLKEADRGLESTDEVEQDAVREKMAGVLLVNQAFERYESIVGKVARYTTLFLLLRSAQKLWFAFDVYAMNSPPAQTIIKYTSSVIYALLALSIPVDISLRRLAYTWAVNPNTNQSHLSTFTMPMSFLAMILPRPSNWNWSPDAMERWAWIAVFMLPAYARGFAYTAIRRLCVIFPSLATALRLEMNVAVEQERDEQEGGIFEVDWRRREVVFLETKGFDNLLFFLVTIMVVVLWYGTLYDQTGTVKPRWTEVFG